MLAFYGWTDTLLLNLVNTKTSYFVDEKADLFILDLPRVSRSLVDGIEKSGIFEHIFWIKRPPFHKDKGPLTFAEKVTKLFSGERYYRCYKEQLDRYCGNESYSILFTGAFWSETLFLYRYFRKKQPDIRIDIVEEGTANYISPPGWQFKCMPTAKFRQTLMRCIYFPITWSRARRAADGIYLYSTEIARNDTDIKAKRLPAIDSDNHSCFKILSGMADCIDIFEYQKRDVYFIAGPIISGYEDSFDRTYEIIDAILENIDGERLAVKAHPSQAQIQDFAQHYPNELFVDRRNFAFEAAVAKIELGDKLLIARNSSVLMSIKTRLDKCPCVIYIYRLYDFYSKNGEPTMDGTSRDMLKLYSPQRFCAPNSIDELKRQIKHWMLTGEFYII